MKTVVRTGLDILVKQNFGLLKGLRIGLVTHPAAVDSRLIHISALLAEAPGIHLRALFGPEHGLEGEAQDLEHVEQKKTTQGPQIWSLYGKTGESLRPTAKQLEGLDALVIDLQDVGARYYTFQATMLYCLEAASQLKLVTVVLDRPNPLGGLAIEGPRLSEAFQSFVGCHPMVIRHGMTMGELARMFQKEKNLQGELRIIPCEGWRREMYFDDTSLPWVMPSPNMPTLDTALVYPGQCLLEGTHLSEGRGTTRPFELCGAPWIEPHSLVEHLGSQNWPGVKFRPTFFKPTFQKFAGRPCGGMQIHVADRQAFQPVRTGLAVLAAFREFSGSAFAWRTETYEFVSDRLAIDLLFGSSRERQALDAGLPCHSLFSSWEQEEKEFSQRRKAYLIY